MNNTEPSCIRASMIERNPFMLPVFLFLAALLSTAVHAQPVAMVTSVGGKAAVQTGDKESDAVLGMELQGGDVLEVRAGAASLVFMQGEFLELKAGERIKLGADRASSTLSDAGGTRGVGREETIVVASGGITPSQGKDYLSQLAVMSGVRGDNMPVAVSPRLAVSDPAPVFIWFDTDSAAAGAVRSYTIIVRDRKGGIVLQRDVEGIVYRMNTVQPEGIAAAVQSLPERHYSWAVYEKGKVPSPLPEFDAAFAFVDKPGMDNAAERRRMLKSLLDGGKMDRQAYHTLLTLYYIDERERLFADAVPHLLALSDATEARDFADLQLRGILPRFGNQVSVAAAQYFASRRNSP